MKNKHNEIYLSFFDKIDYFNIIIVTILIYIFSNKLVEKELFDKGSLYYFIGAFVGIFLNLLIVRKIILKILIPLNLSPGKLFAIVDFFRFGTILLSEKIIKSLIAKEPIIFESQWIKKTILNLIAFVFFNIFVMDFAPEFISHNHIIDDVTKLLFSELFALNMIDGKITGQTIIELIITTFAYIGTNFIIDPIIYEYKIV